MKFAIVSHHSRAQAATVLAAHLNAVIFTDDSNRGSAWNHRRALEWAALQDERVIIVEDDAIPVVNVKDRLVLWLYRFPENLMSFYLGTSRPPQWQGVVTEKVNEADTVGVGHISLPKLIHGVAYSIPKKDIPSVLTTMEMGVSADFSIGDAWIESTNKEVIYTVYSLFEHEDGESIERHADGKLDRGVRKARRLSNTLAW